MIPILPGLMPEYAYQRVFFSKLNRIDGPFSWYYSKTSCSFFLFQFYGATHAAPMLGVPPSLVNVNN